jgi:radical SAM superfamily enzyme YgiQ (UPF0313 family)
MSRTSKIRVGLVQLNTSFSGQYYLPLSAGMLQAYAQTHLPNADQFEFVPPLFTFLPIDEAVARIADCDLVGFSVYVWNEQNSLAIAEAYKKVRPDGIVIFGGPQVPNSHKQFRRKRTIELTVQEASRERMGFTRDYHRAYPFIDAACHGEGERVFMKILERMAEDGLKDKSGIPALSYFDDKGVFHFNAEIHRMMDPELADAPSPLTTGVFDKLMGEFPEQKWILMYETDRGCPYSCTYCDWGGATEDRIGKFDMEHVRADIMWIGERKIPYVFLCNANFGILERDVQIAEYFVEAKARYGYPEAVSTQNAKNPKDHTIKALKVLERAGLNKATVMSQQSLNTETLKAVRRDNMKLDEYYEIQKQLAADGTFTMTDLILGMPNETYDSIADAVSTLISRGQHNRIQFNNLSILRNTEMGDPEYQREHGMQIVKAKMINGHGKKNNSISGIEEWQQLVVATRTMPPEQWRKTRAFCWMVNLIYFNKLLQYPAIVLHEGFGLSYKAFFECFTQARSERFPLLARINTFFESTAKGIQDGVHEEYVHSKDWLDVYWPPEEYAFIMLVVEGKLGDFYTEVQTILEEFLPAAGITLPADLLNETLQLNQKLIKVPFQTTDTDVTLSYNIDQVFQSVIRGEPVKLETTPQRHLTINRIQEQWTSWDDWYQRMVWYGNRRGAYLYGTRVRNVEIAGHH